LFALDEFTITGPDARFDAAFAGDPIEIGVLLSKDVFANAGPVDDPSAEDPALKYVLFHPDELTTAAADVAVNDLFVGNPSKGSILLSKDVCTSRVLEPDAFFNDPFAEDPVSEYALFTTNSLTVAGPDAPVDDPFAGNPASCGDASFMESFANDEGLGVLETAVSKLMTVTFTVLAISWPGGSLKWSAL